MPRPFLEVDALSKRYADERGGLGEPVFDDVSFGIERGEFVCIVGHSGCGKTTILNVLSGMKQRVGIARAFAIEPKMLLLDEPFGALDALTRGTIQDELLAIVQATHQTVFIITHDVDEAILLADKVLLMSNGPRARIAEIVVNTMPRTRTRNDIHHDPQYYRIRNHLVDFLVARSKQAQADSGPPLVLSPGLDAAEAPLAPMSANPSIAATATTLQAA